MQEKGRRGWQKAVGYGRRALVETAMFRYKVLIGPTLRARALAAQKTEAQIACSVINWMTQLETPLPQQARSLSLLGFMRQRHLVPVWQLSRKICCRSLSAVPAPADRTRKEHSL